MQGLAFEQGAYGLRGVITAPWREEMRKALEESEVRELELNDGKGWRGDDLSFLSLLPQLRSFKILDLRIVSDEAIHTLHALRELTVVTYCENEINFSAFPELETCSLEWRTKASSLFDCMTLRDLFLNRYDGRDAVPLKNLLNLETLGIMNSPVETLEGLSVLKKLRSLRLGRLNCLKSLEGIQGLINLEELEIQRCRRIGSIQQAESLSKLRKFFLNDSGEIESLKPIAKLDRLEEVLFYESTNILDGNLTFVAQLPALSKTSFRNRRHYSHRCEDFNLNSRS
jgi:hypothetical protein